MIDPLAIVLHDLRLAGSTFKHTDARAPWGLGFAVADGPSFHVIVSGQCCLRLDSQRIPLTAGNLVVLPHGENHQLANPANSLATPLADIPGERIGYNAEIHHIGGTGEPTLLICGSVHFAGPIANPLVDLLPRILSVHQSEGGHTDTWMDTTLAMLRMEAVAQRPGMPTIMTRLTEILVLQTIRDWLERNRDQEPGWLAALHDPQIGQALALIHGRPEDPWTVARLAGEVHLSRSVFAQRFSRLVGSSPMQYLTRWRMQLASSWMREDGLSASEAAFRLGYSSEAAFSRVFKRHLQILPSEVRRGG